jgi:hypothetical protein
MVFSAVFTIFTLVRYIIGLAILYNIPNEVPGLALAHWKLGNYHNALLAAYGLGSGLLGIVKKVPFMTNWPETRNPNRT